VALYNAKDISGCEMDIKPVFKLISILWAKHIDKKRAHTFFSIIIAILQKNDIRCGSHHKKASSWL